jgi:hypothetical protein
MTFGTPKAKKKRKKGKKHFWIFVYDIEGIERKERK